MRYKLTLTTDDGVLLSTWILEDEQTTPSLDCDFTYPLSVPTEARILTEDINREIRIHEKGGE